MLGFLVLHGDADEGTPPVLALVAAWAISTHGVRVELTTEPKHSDPYEDDDALNVNTWTLVDLATGEPIMVIGVTMYDATHVDLITLDALPDHLHDVELSVSTTLRTPLGDLIGGSFPLFNNNSMGNPSGGITEFPGVVQTLDPLDAVTVEQFRDRDLENPPFQVDRGIGYHGTIVIGADGDYETEAGLPLIKKMVMRRMGTKRGAHRHLPRFGVGLVEKEPIPSAGDLIRLRADIESQAMEEPDVESALAHLTLDRGGVLIVQLQIVAKGATLNIRMGTIGGRLVEL